MHQNSPPISSFEGEINLFTIVRKLKASKNLIIILTLLFTILGSIYSYQKTTMYNSTALVEIGNNDQLIEPLSTLIQELNINFIHKQNESLNLESIENRLIKIITVSPSSVENEKKINRIVDYIEDRHLKLINNNIKEIEYKFTSEIEFKNKEIEFKYSTLLSQISNKKLILSNEILKLENNIPIIDHKIIELNSIINQDQKNLLALKSNPALLLQRAAQSPTLNQVIFIYKLQLIQLEAEKINISQLIDNLKIKLQQSESEGLESADIFELSQEIDNLELELEFIKKKKYINSQLIGEIQTNALETNQKLIILFFFSIGLFFSFAIIYINEFVKTFKNSH